MTLIELMVALVILSVLTSFAFMYYGNVRSDAENAKVKSDINALKSAMTAYLTDETVKLPDGRFVVLKKERPSSLSQMVLSTFRVVDPEDSTAVSVFKRSFIEEIPKNPLGPDYYADLYYICAKNPLVRLVEISPVTGLPVEKTKTTKVAYTSPTTDNFGAGKFSTTFYRCQLASGATIAAKTGEVTIVANNGSSSVNSAALFTTVRPITVTANPKNNFIFEFTFDYTQSFADNPVVSTNENRVLESSAPSVYKNSSNGIIFIFRDSVPAFGNETQIMSKNGVGFKFSETQWELYHSPSGGGLVKLETGGMEPGNHSMRFAFKSDVTYVDCYLDGDLKATARMGPAGAKSHIVYPVLSPDLFTDTFKVSDCTLRLKQVVINSIDFSDFYDDFLIPAR